MIICKLQVIPVVFCYLLMMNFSKLSLALKDDISEVKGDVKENAKVVTKLHEIQKGDMKHHFNRL
jgi:hypothetical protein